MLSEPGGLSTRQIIDVIHALTPAAQAGDSDNASNMGCTCPSGLRNRRVIGADFVEFNVAADVGANDGAENTQRPGMTAMVGAKLLKELASVLHRSNAMST